MLIRLDETVTRANLAIVTKGLTELYARHARLAAERDGADTVAVPPELADNADDPEVQGGDSKRAQAVRSAAHGPARPEGATAASGSRNCRSRSPGSPRNRTPRTRRIALIEQELAGVRDLWQKNLVQLNRLTSLEREEARLEGERGQLVASAAEAKGKIAEIQLQITPGRPGVVQRRRQGAARDRQQDRRICRAQGHRRGSAQAHRYSRAAGRRRVPVDREHCRRRGHRRRSDHADRAGKR